MHSDMSKNKILIVDDEVMLTGLLSDHLQDNGYITYAANDAGEALRLLKNEPNLILLDINMPGIEVAKWFSVYPIYSWMSFV